MSFEWGRGLNSTSQMFFGMSHEPFEEVAKGVMATKPGVWFVHGGFVEINYFGQLEQALQLFGPDDE